ELVPEEGPRIEKIVGRLLRGHRGDVPEIEGRARRRHLGCRRLPPTGEPLPEAADRREAADHEHLPEPREQPHLRAFPDPHAGAASTPATPAPPATSAASPYSATLSVPLTNSS